MKWIDIPPVWLLGALVIAWQTSVIRPFGLSLDFALTQLLGGLLVGGGLVFMLLAITEMRKRQTTVIPHREAQSLVTTGIFKRSRNPIYLGDAMILAGLILRWDAPLAHSLSGSSSGGSSCPKKTCCAVSSAPILPAIWKRPGAGSRPTLALAVLFRAATCL